MRLVNWCCAAVLMSAALALTAVANPAPAQFGGLIKKKIATVATGQAQAVKPAGENVAFDNITLELTPERLDKIIAGKQAGRKIAEGPNGLALLRGRQDSLTERLAQLRDKNQASFSAWDQKRSAIESCRDSVLHAAEKRIADNFQMTVMGDPAVMQKLMDLGTAIQKANAQGDTALVRKLTLQTAAMTAPTRADSLAADRKCGSLKDAPAVVAQAAALQTQLDGLADQLRNAEISITKAELGASGLNEKQLAMSCERIQYYFERLGAKGRQVGFTAAELDALGAREKDLRGLCT